MAQPFSHTVTHQLPGAAGPVSSGPPPLVAYRGAQALAADSGPVVAEDLPDSASGVEAFSQQEGTKEEEEAGHPIDGVLEIVDPVGEKREGGPLVQWRHPEGHPL